MTILGIETSCDETAAAVIKGFEENKSVHILSNVISTSLLLHAKTGGIIPEQAAREQLKYIIPVIEKALDDAKITFEEIDAVAVTMGPGLIGSLLVGVETAKTISYVLSKPIIPVNHLIGHIYANFIQSQTSSIPASRGEQDLGSKINFPALALIVSGGHTDLVLMKKHGDFKLLGGTRDDAAGEALDKIGRLLGMPYPAGPTIEKAAAQGDPKKYNFPRPMIDSGNFEFSFSGLKTAALREVQKIKSLDEQTISDISAGVQRAIVYTLVKKTLQAAEKYKVKSILLSGGVAANSKLRENLASSIQDLGSKLFVPPKSLCTDNAAMIASAAFFNYQPVPWQKITADPELYFS